MPDRNKLLMPTPLRQSNRSHSPRRTWLALATVAGFVGVVVPSPAQAANPACPSGYAVAVIQTVGDHVRSKACYREATDDWVFQDTYADGYGTLFNVPSNDQSYNRNFDDKNGANNGWIKVDSEYKEDVQMVASLCLVDGIKRLSCTTSGWIVA